MADITQITVVGNLTTDPELRFTSSGKPVATFTIASTPRRFDRDTNQWVDKETTFVRSTLWGPAAENAAQSFSKGARVIAVGDLEQNNWETREGEKRSSLELKVTEIGASTAYATIDGITKATNVFGTLTPIPTEAPAGPTEGVQGPAF